MADETISKRVLDLCEQAVGLNLPERERFLDDECRGDVALRVSVNSVLLAVDNAGRFLDAKVTPAGDEVSLVGRQIGHYRVMERLGTGGMGSVYLAQRQEEGFEQRVAIKFVHGHMLARELIERFAAERKILAALNHPYIAALIDGGTTEDGIPYIVMEYVQGVPINEYCDARQLNVRDRIKLLQKIALAVQAAHQNLVIHRDLKPSNVLVTQDGIPKLLDFGIAKLLQPGSDGEHGNTTVFGRQAMTPDYASPEQILESKVTTASDVYSLGVLSYELLTGERPYHIEMSSHAALVRTVEGLTVPRASTRLDTVSSKDAVREIARQRATTPPRLRKLLAGDVDNILIKALHREPQRRYPSVGAFSADFDRYLNGLPVEARPDTLGYRFGRFVVRHRVGVGAGLALTAALLVGLGISTWAYLRAEAARADASARFDQVRELANTMMFDVFGEIENLPGAKTAQQTLASTAQTYLEALSQTPNAPADVKYDAARGYARLSAIFDDQSVADPQFRVRSEQAAAKALHLFQELTRADGANAAAFRGLAKLHSDRGNANLYTKNDPVQSRAEIELALVAFDQARRLAPNNVDIAAEQITARLRLADTYKWQNDNTAAEALLDDLLVDATAARDAFPGNLVIVKVVADTRHLRGEVRLFDERYAAAVEDFERALEMYNTVGRGSGDNNPVRQPMVITSWSLGNALINLDRPEEAAGHYRRALELTEVRFVRDPNDNNARRTYAILQGSLASALVRTGNEEEAFETILAVNNWFEAQAIADPDTPGVQRTVAVGYQETADIYAAAGRDVEACQWYRRTLDKWREIDERFGLSDFDVEQPALLEKLLADC